MDPAFEEPPPSDERELPRAPPRPLLVFPPGAAVRNFLEVTNAQIVFCILKQGTRSALGLFFGNTQGIYQGGDEIHGTAITGNRLEPAHHGNEEAKCSYPNWKTFHFLPLR